ncbi:hypothetical protein HYE54_04985 [Aggregatibacter actinomycetemcomitans]|uniref:hypothetical protein n=1 Tax=Aggregatibacter actinomycetemcomitans TaxID=714 RepID=UPI00197BF19C|nr:hypothetical protein [Aggregatibacter actinomycetemcomitans]MBN6068133.1 hypothetical protein [Aggregatibacter actinomycetemcomitans]MBN6086009.1 hypothetical protein [Aggregatibacter actinomycetemcomitans]
MKEYWVSYTYSNDDGKSRTQTTISVKGESERDVKDTVETKHRAKGQKVVEWRKIKPK